MKKSRLLSQTLLVLALAFTLWTPDTMGQTSRSTTTVVMNFDVVNGFVPAQGPSRISVPPGETVYLQVPPEIPWALQWTKDNQPIAGATDRVLALGAVTSESAGYYSIANLPWPQGACGIVLEIAPVGNIANLSSRFELSPSGPPAILGFVVTGTTPKLMLYRAVGPSLEKFGVPRRAADPVIRIYDSNGLEVLPAFHPAVVLNYNKWFAELGAFPLTGGEAAGRAFDFNTFKPGAYTAHVQDASGAGGTVLVELYEAASGPSPK